MTKSALLVSTAVGLTLAVTPSFASKQAATHPSLGTIHQAGLKGWANGPNHGLVLPKSPTLALTWTDGATSFNGFFFDPSSPVTFKCKSAAACHVITESVAQVFSQNTTGGTFDNLAICPVLNHGFTNGSCYYSGNSHADDLYHTITNDTNGTGITGVNTGYVLLYSPHNASWGHRQDQWHR